MSDRNKYNDLILGAVFNSMDAQGYPTGNARKIYDKQRLVIEAEEIVKEETNDGSAHPPAE